MTEDQLTTQIMEQNRDIAALWENTKSAHRRIDENDSIIKGIHKLAANVEALALEVKLFTERMDISIDRMEQSIKSQGARIGALETVCRIIENNEKNIAGLADKVEHIEKEPANKWKDLVKQMITFAAAALMGSLLANFIG